MQDPVSGEIGYASVLGAGKGVFGLAFYLGEEGLASLVSPARVQAVKAACKPVDAIWEVDASLAPIPIQEKKNSRPYYTRFFLCADAESRLILSYDMLPPGDLPQQLQSRFLNLVKESRVIPHFAFTQNYATRAALLPLAEKLGFGVVAVRFLPAVQAIRQEILKDAGIELI